MTQPRKKQDLSPRYETGKAMLIAGYSAHYTEAGDARIPAQWQCFGPHIGRLQGQVGQVAYGVISNVGPKGFDYLTGVEVESTAGLPAEFGQIGIPAGKFAVFTHRGHISAIADTMQTICTNWLPKLEAAHGAPSFERYGKDFDPKTGSGMVEIWLPIKS